MSSPPPAGIGALFYTFEQKKVFKRKMQRREKSFFFLRWRISEQEIESKPLRTKQHPGKLGDRLSLDSLVNHCVDKEIDRLERYSIQLEGS